MNNMNFREKAASFILSNKDLTKALQLLDNAVDNIPEEIIVWDKFEFEPLENIIEYIDDLKNIIEEAYHQGKNSYKLDVEDAIQLFEEADELISGGSSREKFFGYGMKNVLDKLNKNEQKNNS